MLEVRAEEVVMMWQWGNGMWGWHWGWMAVMMLLVLALVIGTVVWVAAWAAPQRSVHRSYEQPRDMLDRRLASGEITPDQYVEARDLLQGRPRS